MLFRSARADWQPLVRDVAAQLLLRHGGRAVTLRLREHYLPDPQEVLESRAGDDVVTALGSYGWAGGATP